MRNICLVLVLLASFGVPAFAQTAKVKIGKIKANINTNKENNTVSMSQAGNILTIGYGYTKTKINGLKTRSTTISQVIQFAIDGELEAGKTYNFDTTSSTPIVTAVKTNVKNTLGYGTSGDLSASPDASGSLKVISYDSATGEIKALFKAKVSPIQIQKNTKVKDNLKGISIKAKINGIIN